MQKDKNAFFAFILKIYIFYFLQNCVTIKPTATTVCTYLYNILYSSKRLENFPVLPGIKILCDTEANHPEVKQWF